MGFHLQTISFARDFQIEKVQRFRSGNSNRRASEKRQIEDF